MDTFGQQFWRWSGGVALATAVLMLVAGQTLLNQKLTPVQFLAYWGVCILLTTFAIVAAFLDLRRIRGAARDQQKKLFENTVASIRDETVHKPKDGPKMDGAA